MSSKKRPKEDGGSTVSAKSSKSAEVQTPKTSSSHHEGCRKCGRDDDHPHLLLCEACNYEIHTYCLEPPLDRVPEGDFFCDKCKPLKAFCINDSLDEQVAALPPLFTSRFGEIIWAAGGVGFGWWPACIYDPRLTIGGARKFALKNIGKKHLVYFFGCTDAPFTALSDSKCVSWENGLMEDFDSGKAAKAMGKTRSIMFEWALQAATAEHDKPIEYRLNWNHEEDAAVLSGKPLAGVAVGNMKKPAASAGSASSGKRSPPAGSGNTKKNSKKTKTDSKPKGNDTKSEGDDAKNGNGKKGITTDSDTSKPSPDPLLPTRRSNRQPKPSKSFDPDLISSLPQSLCTPKNPPLTPASDKSPPKKSSPPIMKKNKSSPCPSPCPSPSLKLPVKNDNVEFFCKICRNDDVISTSNDDLNAFTSSINIGFITLPSFKSSTFADARSTMIRDFDEDCLPSKWNFYVPMLGPMSRKQEKMNTISILKNTTTAEHFGDGTSRNPLKIIIYSKK